MHGKDCRFFLTLVVVIAWVFSSTGSVAGQTVGPKASQLKVEGCYECHETVKDLHVSGKHAKVRCDSCHKELERHVKDPSSETRPPTDTSWGSCGQCHKEQFKSIFKVAYHRPARDEKSQLTSRAPNPFWDKLMMGHGFTKEHDLTRSHIAMLLDHLVVDRAYGGRFQPKKGWEYVVAPPETKLWDMIADIHPEVKEQKVFRPQTAIAANPVCFQCKSQDHILDWAYMGDPVKGAKWSRTSNVVDVAKSMNHGLNCFTCHDPHAAKPRIVRDALIDALTRPSKDTLWHKDGKRTGIKVLEMGTRGYTRKIAILEKYDSRLQCGQCHVEYNCNPGTDTKTGQPVTMADRRANHFPYKNVLDLYEHYVNQVNFLDFRHGLTGGLLWKAQHPESETFYDSRHAKAGVTCGDCHSPKVKDPKSRKVYTSHFAVTPRVQLRETCLKCHKQWTSEQALYSIDSVKAYIKGKLRKSEFWLVALIDRIIEAKKAGVGPEAIKEAQTQHLKAHILWEYWTAENSDGFHNPDLARESLTRSVDESQKGIALLDKAMAK